MAVSKPPGLKLGVIEPRDAFAAFEERRLLAPSFRWQEVWQDDHQRQFVVAGVMREDILAIFREELAAKFAEAGDMRAFTKSVRSRLVEKGFWGDVEVTDPQSGETRITRFDNRRLQLIYDVNVRQSHAAGKWKRYNRTKKAFPFILYRTMDDSHVRLAHQAWHNLVLPIDDAFWQTHWPPNGWRCRCTVIQLNQQGVDRLQAAGQRLKFSAPKVEWLPYVNPHSGEVKAVPRGIDPGFGYNPGVRNEGRDTALAETVLTKAIRSDAYSGAVMAAQAATDMPSILARRAERFAQWVQDAATRHSDESRDPLAQPAVFALGLLQPAAVRTLAALGTPVQAAAIAITDTTALSLSETVAANILARLPVLLGNPAAVLRIEASGELLYVIELEPGRRVFVWLEAQAGQPGDGKRLPVPALNLVRAVTDKPPGEIRSAKSYAVLWGQYP